MQQANIQLEQRFHQTMLDIYEAARHLEPPYYATRFYSMVNEHGGKNAADILLATDQPSDGFTKLYLRGRRLDLSVEFLVLKNPWRNLFTSEQLTVARERLRSYKFDPPPEDAT